MATQTQEVEKTQTVSPHALLLAETTSSTSAMHKKAVSDLMAELDLEDQQAAERDEEGRFTQWARNLTTSPEILIMVVWIAMMYALWTQFKGPILALLK